MSDKWPTRNLGRSEHWGRTIEQGVDYLEKKLGVTSQTTAGTNRNVATTSVDLSNNIQRTLELAEDIEQALLVTPQYFVTSASKNGFALGGWQTVVSRTIPAVEGFTKAEIAARGLVYNEQDPTPVPGGGFVWPFPTSSVTSEYGPRPPLPFHNGIDFGQAQGTPIPSSSAGVVIRNFYAEDYGNYLRVDVSSETGVEGSWLGYAHMQFPSPLPVGTVVTQGQTLGLVGTTGFSTGPHLHWETAPGGDRINPRDFMVIFGDATTGGTTELYETQARIVINGDASPIFKPYAEVGRSPKQQHFPIWGRSFAGLDHRDTITVQLQVRSVGANLPTKSVNRASLTVRGGFSQ